jgi:RNA polymerase sigma-70 factor (ECF subfamily)
MSREAEDAGSALATGTDEGPSLAELRSGHPTAFERLVRLYGGRLLAVARRILDNEDEARDALQDAFVSAFRSIRDFQGGAAVSTWLHRIVVNASLMKLRARRARPEQPIDPLLPAFLEDGHQARPAREWGEPADLSALRREVREVVRRRIGQLPETYRVVLTLRDIEQLDTKETADLLGIEPNAVKVRLHRARQALRTLLDDDFGGRSA